MSYRETDHLRVLIANERRDRLALVAPIVASLGHEVIAREIEVNDVGAVTARERPDVALVGLGESSDHALMLIEKIVQESACPVIVLLHAADPEFVKEASKRGVFAYITDAEAIDWQSSIDIVLRRFTEYHDLEGAFGRRATIERAKGILMERHSVDETAPSRCCATARAPRTASSWTSPPPSWTGTRSCPKSSPAPSACRATSWRSGRPRRALTRAPARRRRERRRRCRGRDARRSRCRPPCSSRTRRPRT